MAEILIKGLTKSFGGAPVLSELDLAIETGHITAILGASGGGKTTLLRLLCGFERADAGTIEIGGHLVCGPGVHAPPERRAIGYVAQEGALFPHLSVAANVVFGLPRSMRSLRGQAEALLEQVGLPATYARRSPQELSGGEQQRVALARALAPMPKLILLDEPFSALDAVLRVETQQAVVAALSHAGATALLVTHDQSEALSIGRKVAVLRGGSLVQIAVPTELYRNPVDAGLAQFVGDAVLLPGMVEGEHVVCALGRLPLATSTEDGPAEVLIRPEQIRVVSPWGSLGIKARVLATTFYGPDARVVLSLTKNVAPLTARVAGHRIPQPGDEVGLFVEGSIVAYSGRQ